ncbi:MAG: DUF1697 domain-containing protein [Parasphingopyxis sp.]
MSELVVLMRAVNVGGRTLPMAELRALCEKLGFGNPQTYIQSGNLLIDSDESPGETGNRLGAAIEKRFGFEVPLIIREARSWRRFIEANPFAGDDAVVEKMLHMLLADRPPPEGAVAALEPYTAAGERIRTAGDALWIDYADGVGRSKLTPSRIDKAWGAKATARNLRTVRKLQDMIEERTG